MRSRIRTLLLCFITLLVLPGLSVLAQQTATRSHVERFSTPEVRAERSEAEATAKLAANANDTEALNARALARMHLGRYSEAYDDLRRAAAPASMRSARRASRSASSLWPALNSASACR